jgi:hypothetical protein
MISYRLSKTCRKRVDLHESIVVIALFEKRYGRTKVLVDDNTQVFGWVVDYYWLDEVALQSFANFAFRAKL